MSQVIHSISVIICAYTEKRWEAVEVGVEWMRQQARAATEIIVVIDHNPGLLKRVQEYLSDVVVVENTEARGLRGARNCGVAVAKSRITAFLDDDAIAIPDWLMFLYEGYTDPQVLCTGGAVIPFWVENKPAWLPEEFYWVVGCTYQGMSQNGTIIRNPIGANMSFRREVFDVVGNFHSEIEQIGPRHAGGCEETELCIRARQNWPQSVFLYHPKARVFHRIPNDRTTWHYFCSRCYTEGLSKSVMTRYVGVKEGLAAERTYTLRILPRGILQGLADALFHHDLIGLARAGAIIVGLAVTIAGYLIGSIFSRVSKSKSTIATEAVLSRNSEVPRSLPARTET